MKKSEILEAVLKVLPYPGQIREIELDGDEEAIRFKWRENTYRVSDTLHVEIAENGCLVGHDITIIFRALLERELK